MIRTLASIFRPRWLFWLCAVAILVLSLLPPTPDMPTTGWDKANHAFGFALLAVLGGLAYPGHPVQSLLGLLAYGAFIEVLQGLTSWRTAEAAAASRTRNSILNAERNARSASGTSGQSQKRPQSGASPRSP